MKRIKTIIFIGLIFLAQISLRPTQDTPTIPPEAAPLNPDYIEYLEEVRNNQYRLFSDDGYPFGYIPSSVDLSHVLGIVDHKPAFSYPSTYDLRTKNKLTPVRDQGQCGSCWTFGAYGSLESYLMPSESQDFSEQHLNANHGFSVPECEGGNAWKATAYLSRWDGPIAESDVPYPYRLISQKGYTIQKHVQQVVFLPERTNKLDNNTIKYFVTNYGAVNFAYLHSDNHYNGTNYSYYYNGTTRNSNSDDSKGWHSVVIVGWNENYSKNNFNFPPPGNGAFIAKNSWGANWGQNGYFYISYYDNSLRSFTSFNNAEPTYNYDKIYQYDPLGWTASYGYNSTTAWGANIFTASDNKSLKAVSFYTNDSNVKYDIYIYTDVKSGKPRSGTLQAQISGSKSYPGYYTVKLDSAVLLNKGDRFSVVIKFKNSSYKYPIPVEAPNYGGASSATANLGQSFVDKDGTGTWFDIAGNSSNRNICIKAFTGVQYTGGDPKISCSRTKINFGSVIGKASTGQQTFAINNSGTGDLRWSLSDNADWLNCSPSSGTNTGTVKVSVDASGLSAGSYTGYISVTAPYTANSPQQVAVNLTVKNSWQAQIPFGAFSTPTHGSTVRSSIPVTGWVLDDVEIDSVKIYNGNTYIGDAILVEGARPDVEQAYPDYPMNYKAGWGYMLLTNFFPNNGNGTYTLRVKATDKEGHVVTLGSKTIYCDNAHAVKPFGAIDTPAQGGTVSGNSFVNWGWALTPQPNKIPKDGSTIKVVIDGVKIGSPKYNIYRSDIATKFPSYANSDGAIGYYTLDTTSYANGLHTIQWVAIDNAGNKDGIGSRYFTIQNAVSKNESSTFQPHQQKPDFSEQFSIEKISGIPLEQLKPIMFSIGYNFTNRENQVYPNANGIITINTIELERIRIHLGEGYKFGYLQIGAQLRKLPIGTTLDSTTGTFYWLLGPGQLGEYSFVFVKVDGNGQSSKKRINIHIKPKY